MDGRPLAIGQAAGFHSCGQVHRDLSAVPPRDRRADRDEWAEVRYVSTREAGIVHTSGMRERRAAILGDRCSLGPECCGSHSLPTSSDAVFRYGAACSVRHGLASRDPCEGTAPNVAKDVVRMDWRNKAVSCSEAPSNTSNSSVLSDSSSFSCSSLDCRWAKWCEWKRFSPAALSKEIPSSVVAGGRAGFTARLW